jgi:adenylosuccinate synthase
MSVTALVGAQWGDEGKGRIVDFLAQQADVVIRFQGGDNAGHTVINQYGTFRLHLVPSGIFNPSVKNIIGAGTVVNPDALLREMHELAEAGVNQSNLWLSERAQMLMPYHRLLDGLEERDRGGGAIGTTGRGIGPAYADKAARWGLQLGDLKDMNWLRRRLESVLPCKNALLQYYGQPALEVGPLMEQCLTWAAALEDRIIDTIPMVRDAVQNKKDVILEGQLGIMRDLDWGIYPYVTSSNPSSAFAAVGAGLPPTAIDRVIGIVKAYSTAVGAGPFPVELTDRTGEILRETGKEYGATTGRPRRCGWFDGVAIQHSTWLNGFTELAITKLDVLDSLPEIKICTGYRVDGQILTHIPPTHVLQRAEPVCETWQGWLSSTVGCSSWSQLPGRAQQYLCRIEELAGVPIRWVSVGPERERMFPVMRTLKI